jgi:hypothetical protein
MKNVVIIFQAWRQETESLALAFGLGAVQAGADIRLRHLNPSPEAVLAHAGYGTLRIEDLRWAEAIAIFLESNEPNGLGQLIPALDAISTDPGSGGKVMFIFHADRTAASLRLLESAVGFTRTVMLDGTLTAEQMNLTARNLVGSES